MFFYDKCADVTVFLLSFTIVVSGVGVPFHILRKVAIKYTSGIGKNPAIVQSDLKFGVLAVKIIF